MNPVFVHAADLHLGAPLLSLGAGLTAEAKAELLSLVDKAFTNDYLTLVSVSTLPMETTTHCSMKRRGTKSPNFRMEFIDSCLVQFKLWSITFATVARSQ